MENQTTDRSRAALRSYLYGESPITSLLANVIFQHLQPLLLFLNVLFVKRDNNLKQKETHCAEQPLTNTLTFPYSCQKKNNHSGTNLSFMDQVYLQIIDTWQDMTLLMQPSICHHLQPQYEYRRQTVHLDLLIKF